MLSKNNQVENTAVESRTAVRRKLLGSLVAGSGALVLAACGGGGSDSSGADAVANRGSRGRNNSSSSSAASSTSAASSASTTTATTDTGSTTVGAAIQQMQMPHEALPNGVPTSYDWAAAPVVWQAAPPAGFTAMTGWGQIQFASGAGTTAAADTVQLRNFITYALNSSGQLTVVQNQGTIAGSLMLPTFANNTSFPTQMTNAGGVTTVTLNPNESFQFWPTNRSPLPAGTQALVVTCEAKISPPAGATDPNINKSYILSLGADWWQSMTAQWNSSYSTNAGVGNGRFVYLTTDWQGITFTSIQNASAALSATSFNY
jgi:hypothetical protein